MLSTGYGCSNDGRNTIKGARISPKLKGMKYIWKYSQNYVANTRDIQIKRRPDLDTFFL